MSNALAIAAVTRTLRNLLNAVATADYSELPSDVRPTTAIEVTTLPLDRVRLPEAGRSRVNLFLYQTEINPAWRNMDLPRRVRPGEVGPEALPLDLSYVVTVYAENDNELIGHVLLGTAMQLLHDHPVLSRAEIASALALSELDTQIEQVRITPQPYGVDELFRLWSGFQSEYRVSAMYQVAVVLIESRRPLRASLPVLRRGGEDRGALVVPAPAPTLTEVREFYDPALATRPRYGKPAAEHGDVLVIAGRNLGDDEVIARFRHGRLDTPMNLALEPGRTETRVEVRLPAAEAAGVPSAWPAGFYTVELEVPRPVPPSWTSNRLAFALAPSITGLTPAAEAVGNQPFDLRLTCTPQVLPGQPVVLLVGDREVSPSSVTTPAAPDAETSLVFPIDDLDTGAYVLRLRVDGVDSIPIDFTGSLPQFDSAQTLTISP